MSEPEIEPEDPTYEDPDQAQAVEEETDTGDAGSFHGWVMALMAMCERPSRGHHSVFCAKWWLHPEAVARFHALYEEYLKAAGAGEMSSWWVHHWDAHAKALFDPNTGVFRHCSPKMHTDGDDAVRFSLVDGDDSPEYLAAIDDPNPNWYTGDQ